MSAAFTEKKLRGQLPVRDDDAPLPRVVPGEVVEAQAQVPRPLRDARAEAEVVAGFSLRFGL